MIKYLYWFPIIIICIPLDYIIWNVIFAFNYGYCSLEKCASEAWDQWLSM